MASRIGVVALGAMALAASCLSGCGGGPAAGSGGNPAAGADGFRQQGLCSSCVHFAQPAGAQHR